MEGFFLIYKQKGMTSHDVVYKIKKKFNLIKAGHTGTLDPLAEGLLIVLVNNFTKLSFLFEKLDKIYKGIILFNQKFDTLDISGNLLDVKKNFLNNKMVIKSFNFFNKKEYLQIPPIYSAIKIKGQKMYNLARKNIKIEIPPRKVNIYNLRMISYLEKNQVNFLAQVSSGTYIRSLARDIAEKMNTYGCLKKLVRTAIGPYILKNSKYIENITKTDLINAKDFFKNYPKIILNQYLIKLVKNGIILDERQTKSSVPFVVMDEKKNLIAYYVPIGENKYYPKYFFR
jgi:tRNA pseudouridine55 synthase